MVLPRQGWILCGQFLHKEEKGKSELIFKKPEKLTNKTLIPIV